MLLPTLFWLNIRHVPQTFFFFFFRFFFNFWNFLCVFKSRESLIYPLVFLNATLLWFLQITILVQSVTSGRETSVRPHHFGCDVWVSFMVPFCTHIPPLPSALPSCNSDSLSFACVMYGSIWFNITRVHYILIKPPKFYKKLNIKGRQI